MNCTSDFEWATGITMMDITPKAIGATGIPHKGKGIYVVEWMVSELEFWGLRDITLRSDQEVAIESICSEVKKRRSALGLHTDLEHSPRYSHASLGHVERGNQRIEAQVRCFAANLEERCGYKLGAEDPLLGLGDAPCGLHRLQVPRPRSRPHFLPGCGGS